MNEEEFLKEHPSLKGKIITRCSREYATPTKRVSIKDIHETQLDNQKVNEVIDKIRIGIKHARDNPINESTEIAAQTQLDLIGIFERELSLEVKNGTFNNEENRNNRM